MVYKELIKYIEDSRKDGVSDGEIRNDLKSSGWDENHIHGAFGESDKGIGISRDSLGSFRSRLEAGRPSERPLRLGDEARASLRSPRFEGEAGERNGLEAGGNGSVVKGVGAAIKSKFKVFSSPIVIVVTLLLVGVSAFGGWYYYERPKNVFAEMPKKMADLRSFKYSIQVRLSTASKSNQESLSQLEKSKKELGFKLRSLEPASAMQSVVDFFGGKDKPPPLLGALLEENLAQADSFSTPYVIPKGFENVEIEVRSSGIYEEVNPVRSQTPKASADPFTDQTSNGVKNRSHNFSVLFDLSLKQKDTIVGLGAEVRSFGDTFYFRLVEFPVELLSGVSQLTPIGLLDITKYLKNWYSLEAKTFSDLKLSGVDPNKEKPVAPDRVSSIKKLLEGSNLFKIESVSRDGMFRGYSAYRYVVIPNGGEIKDFLISSIKTREERESTKREEAEIIQFVDQLKKAKIQLLVDKHEGYLRRMELFMPSAAFGVIDYKMDISFEFSDFNAARVERPAPTISFDEELKKIVGGLLASPQIKSRDSRRVTDVRQLQLALELHFDAQQSYPQSLSRLAPKFIPSIPVDPKDGTPYYYVVHPSLKGYHLGADLEEQNSRFLLSDSDCDSVGGRGCRLRGVYHRTNGFNGGDTKGCKGGQGRFCYDVTE